MISMNKIIKYMFFLVIVAAVVANTAMTCLLVSWVNEDRAVLRNVQNDLQKLQADLEKEIKLREDLFPKLKKSASLLKKYNRRLDYLTALNYAAKIYECSNEELPMNILTALIVVESSADYLAKSRKGAVGLTQVMPKIWNCDRKTLFDPYKNIEIGSSILNHYVKRHGLAGGLSAYNSGKRTGSLAYARKVLRIAKQHFQPFSSSR